MAGWPEAEPLRVWNPPWTFTLILPLAILPFWLATPISLLVQFGLLLGSGFLLWRFFAPEDNRYWIGLLVAATFVPGLVALRIGQISGWLLAGVVGFLYAERSRRDLAAGGALALLMIKPHVTYLFMLAALWQACRTRRPRIVIGWLAAVIGASAIVLLPARDLFGNYLAILIAPPLDWAPPTLGAWLRFLLGTEHRWLQFLPSLLGVLGLMAWFRYKGKVWRWDSATSPLLLASSLTAMYGWIFDQTILLPVVEDLVSQLRHSRSARRLAVLTALAIAQIVLAILTRGGVAEFFLVWYVPVLAGLYWWGTFGE